MHSHSLASVLIEGRRFADTRCAEQRSGVQRALANLVADLRLRLGSFSAATRFLEQLLEKPHSPGAVLALREEMDKLRFSRDPALNRLVADLTRQLPYRVVMSRAVTSICRTRSAINIVGGGLFMRN